jgi:hypothetical protein
MGDYTVENKDDCVFIDIILAAGSQRNASPFILLEALSAATGESIEYKKITRKAILLANLKNF